MECVVAGEGGVDDFLENIVGRLGGRAKAMVVTGSRQHALALYQAIRRYLDEPGPADLGVLVAFSGSSRTRRRAWSSPRRSSTVSSRNSCRTFAYTRRRPESRLVQREVKVYNVVRATALRRCRGVRCRLAPSHRRAHPGR